MTPELLLTTLEGVLVLLFTMTGAIISVIWKMFMRMDARLTTLETSMLPKEEFRGTRQDVLDAIHRVEDTVIDRVDALDKRVHALDLSQQQDRLNIAVLQALSRADPCPVPNREGTD